MRRLLLVLVLAAFAPYAAAIYKWVDEKGVTHYTEEPPADRKATKVEIKSQAGDAATRTPDTTENWKEREQDFRKRRIEKDNADATEKARVERDAATRKSRCVASHRSINALESRPVYRTNERGERVYLEDKDRAAELAAWREQVRINCDP